MKFLVFGGTGFVGRHLIDYINKNGGEAVSASRSGGGDNNVAVDITNVESFESINFRPDVVINCASVVPQKGKSSKDPQFLKDLFITNAVGAVNIANWAVKNQIDQLINCSTLVVVKRPWPNQLREGFEAVPVGAHVGYSMSKLSQEQLMNECVTNSDVNLTHLRLSAVYGEEMVPEGFIFNVLTKLQKNEKISLTDAKKNTVDFINVKDVCRSIYTIAQKNHKYQIINLASGQPFSFYDLAFLLKEITSSSSEISNSVSSKIGSEANIDITRLRELMGKEYDNFFTLQNGLKKIISKY